MFGEDVDGYAIPVLNEREIRAAAGLLFLMMFIAIAAAISTKSFLLLKYAIAIFLPDMLIRVFINPRFSPSLILGRLIVRNQVPEYVGAPQKRYAWMIGVLLGTTMFTLVNVMNTYSPISGLICLACLVFLFFETAFGICLGCQLYALLYREKARYLPWRGLRVRNAPGDPEDIRGPGAHRDRVRCLRRSRRRPVQRLVQREAARLVRQVGEGTVGQRLRPASTILRISARRRSTTPGSSANRFVVSAGSAARS